MKAETRRVFLKNSVTAFAGSKLLRVTNQRCAASPNEKIIVGCVGIRGRGGSLLHGFSEMTDVEVAVICDIDTRLFRSTSSPFQNDSPAHLLSKQIFVD